MRRTLLLTAALAAVLAASAPAFAAAPPAAAGEAQRMGAWGFDAAGQDTAVKAGDDFYRFANGRYIDQMQIPADRTRYGVFDQLQALSEDRMHVILDSSAANKAATGEEAQIGAFSRAFMDEAKLEQLDAAPLKADLDAVRAATTRPALAKLMAKAHTGYPSTFFALSIDVDAKAPDRYVVGAYQAGIGLPDRSYYLDEAFKAKKEAYGAYIARTLKTIAWPDADAQAKAILDLETKIAEASWKREERRDADKTYNPMTPAQLAAYAPGFPWADFLTAAGVGDVQKIVVSENTAFPKIAAIFAATPIKTLQAWQAFHVVDDASPYLSKRFVDSRFDFRGKALSGQPENRPRWKRATAVLNAEMGEAVAKVYVERYFPPESKAKMEQLVADLRSALAARIQRLDWMSAPTKTKALEKLHNLDVKIGYPVKWRDYSGLTVKDDDLYGNVARSTAYEWAYQVGRLKRPVDKTEWQMTPQTVNAYYDPTRNEIVFPAAILQPPFFDPQADPAVNYGAIGGVIGHEITHGFDDEGRKYDAKGYLADWWTAEDAAKFEAQAKKLGAQYSAMEPLPGAHINGQLTMGENIADLGGALLGLEAYHISLKGQPAPVIDGFTGDQRVMLGWAQAWRERIREDQLRQQLVSDPHSPAEARVIGPYRNVDAWYDAFGVKPGDKNYLPPEERVRIW